MTDFKWRHFEGEVKASSNRRRKSRRRSAPGGRHEQAARRYNLFIRYMAFEEFTAAVQKEDFAIGPAIERYIKEIAQEAEWAIGVVKPSEPRDIEKDKRDLNQGLIEKSTLEMEEIDRLAEINERRINLLREIWLQYRNGGELFKLKIDSKKVAKDLAAADALIDALEYRAIAISQKMLNNSPISGLPETFQIAKISRNNAGNYLFDSSMSGAFVSIAGHYVDHGPDSSKFVKVPAWDWVPYEQFISRDMVSTGLILSDSRRSVPGRPSHFERLLASGLIEKIDYLPKEVRDHAARFIFLSKWDA